MTKTIPFLSERLYCPGPTPVVEGVRAVGMEQPLYHRTPEFFKLFQETRILVQELLATNSEVLLLACSGTGAMEASVLNLTEPGQRVLVIDGGKFGNRWRLLGESYGCDVKVYEVEWGHSVDLHKLEKFLTENPGIDACFFQANETSTGVAFPVEDICQLIAKHSNALLVVDAISGIGAVPLLQDKWGIDCIIGGGQKGLGIPPGLGCMTLSAKAVKNLSHRPKFYFDLRNELKNQKQGKTAFTPANQLVVMLHKSLKMIKEFGFANYLKHHQHLAEATRCSLEHNGFELFAQKDPSPVLTSFKLPNSIDCQNFLRHLRVVYGAVLAGGQDRLSGKILRISHLGMIDPFHLMSGLASLEMALNDFDSSFKVGQMPAKFIQRWHTLEFKERSQV